MTIVKLPSGSYRIQAMVERVRYSITLKHKPTKAEATKLLAEKMRENPSAKKVRGTFEDAYLNYIDVKNNVLSPSTIRGYESYFKNIPDSFKRKKINDIDNIAIQKLINDYSVNRTPKTVRNLHGLVSAVMKMARPELVVRVQLPQKKKTRAYTPTNEDVDRILEYVTGGKYEIPIRLATYGLRRGEICALTIDDLLGDTISINKDIVQDSKYEWVIKATPKTEESNRKIAVDSYTAELIRKQGYVFNGHPEMISRELARVQGKLNIPHFSIHKLRHYFASATHEMGISDADIMSMGGWKTDYVMKGIYREAQEDSVSRGNRLFADRMKKASNFV